MLRGELSPEFMHPLSPWIIEIGSPLVFLGLFIYCLRASMRARTLSFEMLLLLASMAMFWQEFYIDWGVYLLYNPSFKLIPWGITKWTTPNKPWWLVVSYGWFYYGSMMLMLGLIAKLREHRPQWGHATCVVVVALPFFFMWDFALELTAALTGWWSYVYYFGPAVESSRGNFPILYPVAWYAVSGMAMCLVLSYRKDNGRVAFESWFGVERIRHRFAREAVRVVVWSLVTNLVYVGSFTIPVIIIREIFGVPNRYVP